MAFAGAGVTDQTQRVSGLDPPAGGQLPDDRRVDGRVGVKEELLQPFWPWRTGVADSEFGAAAGAGVAFGGHQLGQKPEVGHLFTFSGGGDLGEPLPDGGQAQQATTLLEGRGGGLLGDTAPARHELSRPSKVSYWATEGSGRSSVGTAAERCSAKMTTRPPVSSPSGPAAAPRRWAALRASSATTSELVDPTDNAALIPASTSARSRWRCNSNTSTRARVPAPSP